MSDSFYAVFCKYLNKGLCEHRVTHCKIHWSVGRRDTKCKNRDSTDQRPMNFVLWLVIFDNYLYLEYFIIKLTEGFVPLENASDGQCHIACRNRVCIHVHSLHRICEMSGVVVPPYGYLQTTSVVIHQNLLLAEYLELFSPWMYDLWSASRCQDYTIVNINGFFIEKYIWLDGSYRAPGLIAGRTDVTCGRKYIRGCEASPLRPRPRMINYFLRSFASTATTCRLKDLLIC
jgi:hypothetical protein